MKEIRLLATILAIALIAVPVFGKPNWSRNPDLAEHETSQGTHGLRRQPTRLLRKN